MELSRELRNTPIHKLQVTTVNSSLCHGNSGHCMSKTYPVSTKTMLTLLKTSWVGFWFAAVVVTMVISLWLNSSPVLSAAPYWVFCVPRRASLSSLSTVMFGFQDRQKDEKANTDSGTSNREDLQKKHINQDDWKWNIWNSADHVDKPFPFTLAGLGCSMENWRLNHLYNVHPFEWHVQVPDSEGGVLCYDYWARQCWKDGNYSQKEFC